MLDSVPAQDAVRSGRRDCASDPACTERLLAAGRKELRKTADDLAASDVRDSRAYALAWYLCGKAYAPRERSGPCTLVTAARWVQIEPDSVMPWFVEVDRAMASGDEVALAAAMKGAAAATRSEAHWGMLAGLAAHPLLEKADRATQLVALTQLSGIRAAMPLPVPHAVRRLCLASEPLTDGRRQQCKAIASTLTRGSTLLELGIGIELGRAAGWPDESVSALRDKADAVHALSYTRMAAENFFSCGFLDQMKEDLTDLGGRGEVGAGEAAIARTGRTAKELAADYRAAMSRPRTGGPPVRP